MTKAGTVAVVGAGATGGYLAARMARAGIDVTVVARGNSLAQIRACGITVIEPDGRTETIRPARVVASDAIDRPVDVALFCVKAYDTEAAAMVLPELLGARGHVVCLQNGVENEQLIARLVPAARVLSGALYIGAQRTAAGVVQCSAPPRVTIGSLVGGDETVVVAIAKMFARAGIDCSVHAQIYAEKWQKFLFNCGLNPLTTITRQRLGPLLRNDDMAFVFDTLIDEAAAVGRAIGAPILADFTARLDATAKQLDISSSMAEDMDAGRPLESDTFTGYVLRAGARAGVSTPMTRAIHGILVALDQSRFTRSPSSATVSTSSAS